ncbi:hypothetical protein Gpo141_00008728 [Globisporangium polare]
MNRLMKLLPQEFYANAGSRSTDSASRRQRLLALSVVVYYGFKLQRLHKDLRFVWSNKGRFSWVKSNSDFNTMDS